MEHVVEVGEGTQKCLAKICDEKGHFLLLWVANLIQVVRRVDGGAQEGTAVHLGRDAYCQSHPRGPTVRALGDLIGRHVMERKGSLSSLLTTLTAICCI